MSATYLISYSNTFINLYIFFLQNRTSSINELRNKLALLRKSMKPEITPVTDATNTMLETDHVRTSQGNELLTPTLE